MRFFVNFNFHHIFCIHHFRVLGIGIISGERVRSKSAGSESTGSNKNVSSIIVGQNIGVPTIIINWRPGRQMCLFGNFNSHHIFHVDHFCVLGSSITSIESIGNKSISDGSTGSKSIGKRIVSAFVCQNIAPIIVIQWGLGSLV